MTPNVKWVAFTVANDGLSVVVNRSNTWASCLTVAELKKIWEPGSKVDNWSQVRDGFPNVPLKLFGAGTDSGTFDYFTEAINGRARSSRSDYLATEDDNVVVTGVEGERGALGYFGFSYYEENKDKLKVLAIDGGKGAGFVTPSIATVQANKYRPLSRPLFIYAKRDFVPASGRSRLLRVSVQQREGDREAVGLHRPDGSSAQEGALHLQGGSEAEQLRRLRRQGNGWRRARVLPAPVAFTTCMGVPT